jgi:diaminopimelate epimerase
MSRKLVFKKMQGIGNDFILIDSQENPALFTNNRFNLKSSELARIADRNFGIGCDQILVVTPPSNKFADFDYLIYNQDGSCAGYCGNGARCVIRYLADKYHANEPITLNTHGRISKGYFAPKGQITINMGQPNFNPEASGYTNDTNKYNDYSYLVGNQIVNFGIVSMGNPHAVIKLNSSDDFNNLEHLVEIAHAIQNSGLFINGVNVNFFVVTAPDKIKLRTYERGVGFTLACGSGACATASYAISQKLCNSDIHIIMPGGSLHIRWDNIKEIEMTGDAAYVFDGSINL